MDITVDDITKLADRAQKLKTLKIQSETKMESLNERIHEKKKELEALGVDLDDPEKAITKAEEALEKKYTKMLEEIEEIEQGISDLEGEKDDLLDGM